jgi:hypothetical protein
MAAIMISLSTSTTGRSDHGHPALHHQRLTFRRVFHDDSWKVKLRTLLEAGIEVFVEENGLTAQSASTRSASSRLALMLPLHALATNA